MRQHLPLLLMAALVSWGGPVRADDYAFGFNPQTGDAWLDARLGDIGVYAAGNLDGYIDEIVIDTGAPRHYVEEWVYVDRYPPADVWMLAEVGRFGGDWIVVERAYTTHRGHGWGAIAKSLGIKPGSPAFHELKSRAGGGRWAKVGNSGKGKEKGKNKGQGKGKPPKD